MTAARSGLAALLAVVVLLAAASAASAQTPPGPLSAARYAAFDASYALEIAIENDDGSTAFAAMKSFCDRLDRTDPLLAVLSEKCAVELRVYTAVGAWATCKTTVGCIRTATRLASLGDKLVRVLRKANRVLAVEVAHRACRSALRTGRDELRAYELQSDGLRLQASARRSGSRRQRQRGQRLLDAGFRIQERLPSTAKEHESFRAACGPPAPPVAPAAGA